MLDWARRIVGDARAMRQEVHALKHGLAGRLRLAAIPTALAIVETLTTPFRARHPDVQFTVLSRTSIEILTHLENLEIDAGLTYLDNEPLGRVTRFRSTANIIGCLSPPTRRSVTARPSPGPKSRKCRSAC